MAHFYGWGSTGGSLLFTTKFPEIPGTHLIDLGRMGGKLPPCSCSVALKQLSTTHKKGP